jgi:hypothetical protein
MLFRRGSRILSTDPTASLILVAIETDYQSRPDIKARL